MISTRIFAVVAGLALPALVFGQQIVSARAGLVHQVDGQVLLNEKPIVQKATQFQEVRDGEYLRTERGRAEVLLTPGVFLRLSEDSQIEMLSSRLSDVRVKLHAGAAVVEADELGKDTQVTVLVGEATIELERSGLYRFDLDDSEPRLRVFTGQALVKGPSGEYRVRAKKEIELAGDFAIRKFDPEDTDPLDRWSRRRANYLAVANISASRMAYRQGYGFTSSQWFWNPYLAMYTFLPYRGIAWSPYGFGFYSPRTIYTHYVPNNPVYAGGGGGSSKGFGSMGVMDTSPKGSMGGLTAISSGGFGGGGDKGGGGMVSVGGGGGGGGSSSGGGGGAVTGITK